MPTNRAHLHQSAQEKTPHPTSSVGQSGRFLKVGRGGGCPLCSTSLASLAVRRRGGCAVTPREDVTRSGWRISPSTNSNMRLRGGRDAGRLRGEAGASERLPQPTRHELAARSPSASTHSAPACVATSAARAFQALWAEHVGTKLNRKSGGARPARRQGERSLNRRRSVQDGMDATLASAVDEYLLALGRVDRAPRHPAEGRRGGRDAAAREAAAHACRSTRRARRGRSRPTATIIRHHDHDHEHDHAPARTRLRAGRIDARVRRRLLRARHAELMETLAFGYGLTEARASARRQPLYPPTSSMAACSAASATAAYRPSSQRRGCGGLVLHQQGGVWSRGATWFTCATAYFWTCSGRGRARLAT